MPLAGNGGSAAGWRGWRGIFRALQAAEGLRQALGPVGELGPQTLDLSLSAATHPPPGRGGARVWAIGWGLWAQGGPRLVRALGFNRR